MNFKRGLALFSAILLFLLYGTSVVCAFLGSPLAKNILMASIFCSICLPAALYGYTILLRYMKEQNKNLFLFDEAANKAAEESQKEDKTKSHGTTGKH